MIKISIKSSLITENSPSSKYYFLLTHRTPLHKPYDVMFKYFFKHTTPKEWSSPSLPVIWRFFFFFLFLQFFYFILSRLSHFCFFFINNKLDCLYIWICVKEVDSSLQISMWIEYAYEHENEVMIKWNLQFLNTFANWEWGNWRFFGGFWDFYVD